MDPTEAYEAALLLLRGTFANHILCCASMICSLCFSVVGYILMTKGNPCSQTLLLMAISYVVSQAFTVAKVSRDRRMTKSSLQDAIHELEFFHPTPQYMLQVLCFFFLAIGILVYALTLLDISPEWYCFTALVLMWVLVSILCLTKSIRDRKDASIWAKIPPESQQGQLQRVIEISIGSLEYRVLIRVSFAVSTLFTLIWIWYVDLVVERKGLLSLAVIFHATAGFHMAKLLRDLKNKEKARELQSQFAFMFMVVSSFLVSLVVPIVAICVMPLEIEQRLFLLVGQLMTSNTCLNLAKMVRDIIEQKTLIDQLPVVNTV